MRLASGTLALVLLAQSAAADWPALHDVIGVEANDVLNIRVGPSANADVIGALGPFDEGVEVISTDETGAWGLVNTGEGAGWASLDFLARQPGQWEEGFPRVTQCFGTEPFWSLDLAQEVPVFDQAGLGETVLTVVEEAPSANRTDRHAILLEGDYGPATVLIGATACSDGMSDRAYGLTGDIVLADDDGTLFVSGCCSLAGN